MRFLVTLLKDTKIANVVKKNPLLKTVIKSAYKFFMFPFTRKGIDVNIGGLGVYRLDYNFALRDYESFGERHNAGFRKWTEFCKGKKTVFDIGAHIGLYTLPASSVIAANGNVYAFEPSEANTKYLSRHLKYNNIHNVVLFQFIVGEATKKRQIFYESKNTDPMNSLFPKKNITSYSKAYRKQISLDDFIEKTKLKPDVIKIDVEGSEYNVLKGSRRVIESYKPIIFLSVHPRQLTLFRSSVEELKSIIDSLGYNARDWDGKKVEDLDGLKEYILMPA